MLYDDERDKYFYDEFEACEYYFDEETKAPDILYETKEFKINPSGQYAVWLAEHVIEFADSNIPELSEEGEYFSESLKKEQKEGLQLVLSNWINRVSRTVEPDYDKPLDFKTILNQYLEEQKDDK